MARRRIYRRHRLSPIAVRDFLDAMLARMGARPGREKLALLWANWELVLGAELGQDALPLGTQGRVLFVKAKNALHMQELQFQAQEMLFSINQFLGSDYFESIRFSIYQAGKSCRLPKHLSFPEGISDKPVKKAHPKKDYKIQLSGKYLQNMDKDSPVARCYAAFAGK